ncbi:hypothetical protein DPMN_194763 [Dreissena polymorpha]|uniref:Uncharacterized protein n=1 Tax=Dreissena polymorpha TaxID=45954 RepID=A0A9D4BF11_DREPO|nr:hypothetical protein DPMN_194763 [Dreissena polymorpha]
MWECLTSSDTVWLTYLHRPRLSGSVWHRLKPSRRPLGTVVDCLGHSGTVGDCLGETGIVGYVWECLASSKTV